MKKNSACLFPIAIVTQQFYVEMYYNIHAHVPFIYKVIGLYMVKVVLLIR